MFLTPCFDFIKNVINWLETHPQMVKIITTLIPCLFITKSVSFIFKESIEERNKRIEAQASLFPKLRRAIKELRFELNKYNRLNSEKEKNIFIMIYPITHRQVNFKSFDYDTKSVEHAQYKSKCEEIKQLINESSCNVSPKNTNRREWYDNQDVIISFCDFMIEMEEREEANNTIEFITEEGQHVSKCKEFERTINYFIDKLVC